LIHFGSGRDTFNRDTAGIRGVARTMKTDGTRRATSASTAVADSTTPPCEIMRQATRNVPAINWFAQAIDQVHRAAAANLSFLNQLIRSLGPSDLLDAAFYVHANDSLGSDPGADHETDE